MSKVNFIEPERISIMAHPELDEKWIQERIADNPSILGLGDLILKDKERIQPRAGRLDLLLQDADSERRYEVEVQLGKTDESHIIRTIEYWDNEKKRYPQYDHAAVIVAEDITSRFLNVISLFNGAVPLIAIQMNAYRNGSDYWLTFTTVVNEIRQETDDEEVKEATDRNYWEKRGTIGTVSMADQILKFLLEFAPGYELKYNKFYIGLAKGGQPDNFVAFKPRKHSLTLEIKIGQSKETDDKIEKAGLDLIQYDPKWERYHLRINKSDIVSHRDLLSELLKIAYGNRRYGED